MNRFILLLPVGLAVIAVLYSLARGVAQTRVGLVAAVIALVSAAMGTAWYAYLQLESSSPPFVVRLVPLAWLVSSLLGIFLGLRSVVAGRGRVAGAAALLLCVPMVPLAFIYATAAMMGD